MQQTTFRQSKISFGFAFIHVSMQLLRQTEAVVTISKKILSLSKGFYYNCSGTKFSLSRFLINTSVYQDF